MDEMATLDGSVRSETWGAHSLPQCVHMSHDECCKTVYGQYIEYLRMYVRGIIFRRRTHAKWSSSGPQWSPGSPQVVLRWSSSGLQLICN